MLLLDFCVGGLRRQSVLGAAEILHAEAFGLNHADSDIASPLNSVVIVAFDWLAIEVGGFDRLKFFSDAHGRSSDFCRWMVPALHRAGVTIDL